MTATLRIQDNEVCEGTGDVLCGIPATCIVEVPVSDIGIISAVFAACDECACAENVGEILEIL